VTTPAAHPPPPPADLDAALARVRATGGRVTAATAAVAGLLYEADAPAPTAEEISDRLADLERSVVYRVLARFEELGIAEHVHLGHGRAVYRRAGLPTVPVVCDRCGRRAELDRSIATDLAAQVDAATGITPDLTHFPLTGTCAACGGT
jgi:Fe2+ or Zn2+ uptake regulation protein